LRKFAANNFYQLRWGKAVDELRSILGRCFFRFEIALVVCTVAKRTVRRMPTAAKCHIGFVWVDRESFAVVIQDFDAAGDEKWTVGANFDRNISHGLATFGVGWIVSKNNAQSLSPANRNIY
jgi:hypothetical protein